MHLKVDTRYTKALKKRCPLNRSIHVLACAHIRSYSQACGKPGKHNERQREPQLNTRTPCPREKRVSVRSLLNGGRSSIGVTVLLSLFRAMVPKKKGNPGGGRDAAHQCEPLDARLEREAVPPHPSIHRFRAVTSHLRRPRAFRGGKPGFSWLL